MGPWLQSQWDFGMGKCGCWRVERGRDPLNTKLWKPKGLSLNGFLLLDPFHSERQC